MRLDTIREASFVYFTRQEFILEDKSFLYIAEMYICTIIQAFEDGHNLQAIVAVFSSLGGNEPGLTGVSEGLNNK